MPATKLGVNVKIARNKHLPSKGYCISHDRFWQIPTKSPDILKILRFEHHPKWWLFSFKWAYFFKIKIHSFQTSLLIWPNQRYHDFIQLGPLESDKQLWSGLEMVHFDWMIVREWPIALTESSFAAKNMYCTPSRKWQRDHFESEYFHPPTNIFWRCLSFHGVYLVSSKCSFVRICLPTPLGLGNFKMCGATRCRRS